MARKTSPRRVVMGIVQDMKRTLAGIAKDWTVGGTVYDFSRKIVESDPQHYPTYPVKDNGKVDVEMSHCTTRQRAAEEYPENQAAAWTALYCEMVEMEKKIKEIKHLAYRKYQHLENPERVASCGCARIVLNGDPTIEHSYGCLDGKQPGWEVQK